MSEPRNMYFYLNAKQITRNLIISGVFVIFVCVLLIPSEDRTLINYLSLIGTLASLLGLAIAIIQIIALKQISFVTQSAINEAKDKLLLSISINDVAEAAELIGEIENALGLQKYEVANIRIKELKIKLLQFKKDNEFLKIVSEERIKVIIDFLSIQITSLLLVIHNVDELAKYEPDSFFEYLQEISTYLSEFKNSIKFKVI